MIPRALLAVLAPAALALGCAGPAPGSTHSGPAHSSSAQPSDDALADVARVHGGAGPWAVAGYRMGAHALRVLGLPRGSFDLEVVHHTPRAVQYACIADGAAASTGASLGKLNLAISEATPDATRTVYRRRSTGETLTLRLAPGFVARFADVPRPGLEAAGREVMGLTDEAIFEVVPAVP